MVHPYDRTARFTHVSGGSFVKSLDRASLVFSNDLTLGTLLERLAKVNDDRRLVEEAGSGLCLTYREAADRVARMAAGIAEQVEPGDRVVVAAPNGYEFFLLCLAASRAGAVPVPVNPQMTEGEVQYVIDDSDAHLVVRKPAEVERDEVIDAAAAEPGDIAAIFYTSGTTGKPKGAELTHAALLGSSAAAALWPAGL